MFPSEVQKIFKEWIEEKGYTQTNIKNLYHKEILIEKNLFDVSIKVENILSSQSNIDKIIKVLDRQKKDYIEFEFKNIDTIKEIPESLRIEIKEISDYIKSIESQPSKEQKSSDKQTEKKETNQTNLSSSPVVIPEELPQTLIEKMSKLSLEQRLTYFQHTDKQYIKVRKGRGGKEYHYVPGWYITQVLNLITNFNWSSEITEVHTTDDEVICTGKISINGTGIVRSAVGQCDIAKGKDGKPLCLGDNTKSAVTDMIKKAASYMGISIDVYRGDYDE